jgi:hypothetical protein
VVTVPFGRNQDGQTSVVASTDIAGAFAATTTGNSDAP